MVWDVAATSMQLPSWVLWLLVRQPPEILAVPTIDDG